MSNYQIAIGIIIVMLLVMLLILFCVILVRLHINKITKYQREIHQQDLDFQTMLTESIIESQEEVRNQIASDLHDDVGQKITILNLGIENLKLDHPEFEDSLEELTDSLMQISESVRSTSHRLHTQFYDGDSLAARILKDINYLSKKTAIKINFNYPINEIPKIADDYLHIIFRMYQEIINNSIKHSKASRIEINLFYDPKFILRITDNGKGFSQEKVKSGIGIINLKKRAEIINFNFLISSTPQKGTVAQIEEK